MDDDSGPDDHLGNGVVSLASVRQRGTGYPQQGYPGPAVPGYGHVHGGAMPVAYGHGHKPKKYKGRKFKGHKK
ncbi:hypothetical protein HaLaN_03849, partial [Haematococcus lacustris]